MACRCDGIAVFIPWNIQREWQHDTVQRLIQWLGLIPIDECPSPSFGVVRLSIEGGKCSIALPPHVHRHRSGKHRSHAEFTGFRPQESDDVDFLYDLADEGLCLRMRLPEPRDAVIVKIGRTDAVAQFAGSILLTLNKPGHIHRLDPPTRPAVNQWLDQMDGRGEHDLPVCADLGCQILCGDDNRVISTAGSKEPGRLVPKVRVDVVPCIPCRLGVFEISGSMVGS